MKRKRPDFLLPQEAKLVEALTQPRTLEELYKYINSTAQIISNDGKKYQIIQVLLNQLRLKGYNIVCRTTYELRSNPKKENSYDPNRRTTRLYRSRDHN